MLRRLLDTTSIIAWWKTSFSNPPKKSRIALSSLKYSFKVNISKIELNSLPANIPLLSCSLSLNSMLFFQIAYKTLESFYSLPSLSFPIYSHLILSILSPISPSNLLTSLFQAPKSFPKRLFKMSQPNPAFHFYLFPLHLKWSNWGDHDVTKVIFLKHKYVFCSKYLHISLLHLE